jgi:hypothetical protein
MLTEVNTPQEVLIRHRIPTSENQRRLIGCVGCKMLAAERKIDEPVVSAVDLASCTGMRISAVIEELEVLAAGHILHVHTAGNPEEPGSKTYAPGDGHAALEFWYQLEQPEVCPLEQA